MGIVLRSRRGAIGTSWQAVALRDALEGLLGVGRASGGKADARAGRVQWLDVAPGRARGDVLHADGTLVQASLEVPVLRADDRDVMLQVARAHPELPARLAAGVYPAQIEQELARHEVSLLPRGAADLSHDCSCLDWPGPCRHVAALAYVLVEAVDEAPLHLLTLRGLALEDLVAPRPPASPEVDGRQADGAPSAARDTPPDPDSGAATSAATKEFPAGEVAAGAELRAARMDPTRLRADGIEEAIGPDAASVLVSFFHAGRAEDLQ